MKKIVLIAVLLLAVPAMADVNFTAVTEPGAASIYYNATGESELVRAFALDITVDNDANIVAITDYKEGVSVSGDKGYGIFPGSIDINDSGLIEDVGTPVADPCQLVSDTQPGLGKSGITIEMGSLYAGGPNAPDPCGLLCKVEVNDDCNMTIAVNVGRGQVVMEGATLATTNLPIIVAVPGPGPTGYTISGRVASRAAVGVDGVTMSGLPGSPVTSGGGYYTDTVSAGWSGTVTPTLSGKGFVPKSTAYSNVMADQVNQDYLAGDGSCLRADICSTVYGNPDGYITSQDYIWLTNYYPVLPATVYDCLGNASCLRADICSTSYGPPDGLITSHDYIWLTNYYPVLPATMFDCCP